MNTGPLAKTGGGNSFKPNPILQVLQHHENAASKLKRYLGLAIAASVDPRTIASAGVAYRQAMGNRPIDMRQGRPDLEDVVEDRLPTVLRNLVQ